MFKTEAPSRIQKERVCRDVFFLIAFVAFWVGMLVVAGIGFSKVRRERRELDALSWCLERKRAPCNPKRWVQSATPSTLSRAW
jgi:hypothetical protein